MEDLGTNNLRQFSNTLKAMRRRRRFISDENRVTSLSVRQSHIRLDPEIMLAILSCEYDDIGVTSDRCNYLPYSFEFLVPEETLPHLIAHKIPTFISELRTKEIGVF